MSQNHFVQFCPNAPAGQRATVDDEGFCTLHGWECGDFGMFLDETIAGEDEQITYTTRSPDSPEPATKPV
jgi:hypothetical protein